MKKEIFIEEAKKRYPIGCKIDQRSAYGGKGGIYEITGYELTHFSQSSYAINNIGVYCPNRELWAEIVSYPESSELFPIY